jgi:hypothetical protein
MATLYSAGTRNADNSQLLKDTAVAWRDKDSVCGPATQSERAMAEQSGGRAAGKEACVVQQSVRRAGWWRSEARIVRRAERVCAVIVIGRRRRGSEMVRDTEIERRQGRPKREVTEQEDAMARIPLSNVW